MISLQVSGTFIAAYAIALIFLTGAVGLYRGRAGILRGDGGDAILHKRIRIHGNLTENAPAFALALVAAEILGLAQVWLWIAVASFVVGRVFHHVLYDDARRGAPMFLTQAPSALLGLWILSSIWLSR